ncbi:MAG: 2-C-methyl-D-erythritol 2,4-cyclodiphosphate synthase [Gammaproteobacteria bacterium]|nr:2-C-methyl-D-erythritol 2,4-cyclodiphosphate synthase [Gammaproteobacteria bacterium]
MIRVGQGFDVHAFEPGDHLILGGISIPFNQAFKAHSDGDVLIHALCDALLGAAALGDIGQYFPDTSAKYDAINSRILLRQVTEMVNKKGWQVGNADMTIIAQAPKMAPHIPGMIKNLASDLRVDKTALNIKATTTEKLGFTGRGEGIAAQAIVCLVGNEAA